MRFAVMLAMVCLGLVCLSVEAVNAQAAPNIAQVMHCIKSGDRDWLTSPLSEAKELQVGATYDRKSYEGKTTIVVVVFQTPAKGQMFDLTEERKGSERIYTVENNGSFLITGNRIDFVDPPLGGVWTQETLARNMRRAIAGTRKRVAVSAISRAFPNVSCKSYVAR